MTCPGCGKPMERLHLEGKLDSIIDVDYCASCRVIWFDRTENLRLSAAATLQLFEIVAKPARGGAPQPPHPMACPTCGARLALTHDMQRATRFTYWRCPSEHGRLISFVDFLREKDFVRPLTLIEINRLRQTIGTVHCDNCGAPIDLVRDSACRHCGSPISILDPTQTARTVAELQLEAAARPFAAGAGDGSDVGPQSRGSQDQAFEAMIRSMKEADAESTRGMVNIGLRFLAELVKKR